MQSWKNWCRLCASDGSNIVDLFIKDLESNCSFADDLKRLCNLKLEKSTDLPTKICESCKFSVETFKTFLKNIVKAQQMFTELQFNHKNEEEMLKESDIKEESHSTQSDFMFKSEKKEFDQRPCNNIHVSSIEKNFIDCNDEEINALKETQEGPYNGVSLSNTGYLNQQNDVEKRDPIGSNNINDMKLENSSEIKINNKLPKLFRKSSDKLRCKLCENEFSSQRGLTTHMKIKHSILKNPHKCKYCGKHLESLSLLERHENVHLPSEERKQLSCPHCEKKFNSESGRWSHIYTVHDKRKAVICEECGKEFSTKHHLVNHKISHKQEKQLKCPHCPARFKGKVGLAAHMDIHGESFPCSLCGVLLNTKQLLKKHMIVHSDVKNFKCNFCNKHFKRSKELNYHLITHIGIKPFECRVCNQKFVHDMTYRRHLKSTHPLEFAQMIEKGERISSRNFPPPEQLKAINEAAKNTQEYHKILKSEEDV